MSSQGSHEGTHGRYLAALSLTALGIVFGDIGTSPIYALRESFHSANGIDPTQANVLGVLSSCGRSFHVDLILPSQAAAQRRSLIFGASS